MMREKEIFRDELNRYLGSLSFTPICAMESIDCFIRFYHQRTLFANLFSCVHIWPNFVHTHLRAHSVE